MILVVNWLHCYVKVCIQCQTMLCYTYIEWPEPYNVSFESDNIFVLSWSYDNKYDKATFNVQCKHHQQQYTYQWPFVTSTYINISDLYYGGVYNCCITAIATVIGSPQCINATIDGE